MSSHIDVLSLYGRRDKGGWSGDKKCNAVGLRVLSGSLIFIAFIFALVAMLIGTQPCCGPRFSNDVEVYEQQCSARHISFDNEDDWVGVDESGQNQNSTNKCYTVTMIASIMLFLSFMSTIIAFTILCWAEMTAEKDDSDLILEQVRMQNEQARIARVMQRDEERNLKKKSEKYEKRAMIKYERELEAQRSIANRNSFPGSVNTGVSGRMELPVQQYYEANQSYYPAHLHAGYVPREQMYGHNSNIVASHPIMYKV